MPTMKVIKTLRRQTGLAQQEMAARAGTAQPTIAAYESGAKSPTVRTVEKTARAVGLWISKAVAGRPKYREFCQALLDRGLVRSATLRARLSKVPDLDDDVRHRVEGWMQRGAVRRAPRDLPVAERGAVRAKCAA